MEIVGKEQPGSHLTSPESNKLGMGASGASRTSLKENKVGRGQADLHEPRHVSPKARPRLCCLRELLIASLTASAWMP